VIGSVALGIILGMLFPQLSRRITDLPTSVIAQFVSTFAVGIIADRLMLSPVITLVCYAITLARLVPARLDGSHRIGSYAVWEVAVFVLNVLAFIMAGLQLRPILTGLHSIVGVDAFGFAGAVLGVVLVVRVVWVMGYNPLPDGRIGTLVHPCVLMSRRRLSARGW
jgi:CPA1 family monovalent cation:H+ antiporter